jgi:hypothetical protein
MEETTTSPNAIDNPPTSWGRYLFLAVIALIVIAAGFFAYRTWIAQPNTPTQSSAGVISETELEEQYGLSVRLIGVTAGGGMIDFRLKMVDADKARQFLQDPANLPVMFVMESGAELLAADTMEDDITWEDGGILFMLLPNSGGEVQPGTPVVIKFGDLQLEPVPAQ